MKTLSLVTLALVGSLSNAENLDQVKLKIGSKRFVKILHSAVDATVYSANIPFGADLTNKNFFEAVEELCNPETIRADNSSILCFSK